MTENMDKDYVLGLLNTTFNNYAIGCIAGDWLSNKTSSSLPANIVLKNLRFSEISVSFNLKPLKNMLSDQEMRNKLINEHMKSLIRSFIKETFEIVKLYANETKQFSILKNADWYQFIRVIRNNLAHDFRFRFRESDKKILPVMWRDKTITVDMDGQPLQVHIMNDAYAIELFKEIYQFVKIALE